MPPAVTPWTGRRVLIALVLFFGVIFAVNGALVWAALRTWPGRSPDLPRHERTGQLPDLPSARTPWTG